MCDLFIAIDIIKREALKIIHDQPLLASRLSGIKRELEDVAKAILELEDSIDKMDIEDEWDTFEKDQLVNEEF